MTKSVEVSDLQKEYRRGENRVEVLEHVDLEVDSGEFVALMGPSGSGKTSLLNIIAGIDTQDAGRVVVEGSDLAAMTDRQKTAWRTRHIGYVFQFHNLLPVMTAKENVELPLLLLPLSKAERRDHVSVALEAVGLTSRADHFPRQLSGGEEQRVAIARAIVTDAKVLLADEPTGSLHSEAAAGILDLLKTLNSQHGKTVIMVTHDAKAAGYASRTLRIHKGHLVTDAEEETAHAS
jgi:putative ABC transport system ATP-binding protein